MEAKQKVIIEALYGFGDNLFLRPLVLAAVDKLDIYCQTPYPELYRNTPIKVVRPDRMLYDFATRSYNDSKENWHDKPKDARFLRPNYAMHELKEFMTISKSFSHGFEKKVFDTRLEVTADQLQMGVELVQTEKPIMLVKIPSYRHDWHHESRAPKTAHMIECLKLARESGFHIVSLQDFTLKDRFVEPELVHEWIPLCHQFLHGKLSIDQLIGLFAISDSVLTYPNFLLPLAVYLDKPVFTIYGGSIHPIVIIDPRIKPKHCEFIAPDPFCHCVESHHECNKHIDPWKLRTRFISFINNRNKMEDELMWWQDFGYGYYPVKNDGVYDDGYFDKYIGYEDTKMGEELNQKRANLAKKYQYAGRILDVGIGSGQFVRAVDGWGYDVCQKAVDCLKAQSRWKNPWKEDLWGVDVVTFFDSFEHEDDIEGLFQKVYGRTIVMSIPIFKDRVHVLQSKHFRPDEHFHYFTREGLIRWFDHRNYKLVEESNFETALGRDGIGTFVFQVKPIEVVHNDPTS